MMSKKLLTTWLILLVTGAVLLRLSVVWGYGAQVSASATPARISIPSTTPLASEAVVATPTWTPTPTPANAVLLEAKSEANVRADPDIDSERLGTIRAGDTYPVIGRSFRWLQFQYDPSPSGTGWVYDDLINIIGDQNAIVDLNANTLPTVDTSIIRVTQTWEAVTLTPGGILTVTANARVIDAPGGLVAASPDTNSTSAVALPTFTYPPDTIALAPTDNSVAGVPTTPQVDAGPGTASPNGIAPITPILILAGLGLMGMAIGSVRR